MDVQSGASRGVGAPIGDGGPSGEGVVAAERGCDGGPAPAPLTPARVNVYGVLACSGPTVQLSRPVAPPVVMLCDAAGRQLTVALESDAEAAAAEVGAGDSA